MADDIAQWLEGLGLGLYVQTFADNDVDADVLSELTDADLKDLGLSLGHRRKLLKAIADQTVASELDRPIAESTTSTASTEAERRQLTVMFCDLVGSTELSARLDPEDLRKIMQRYQDAVSGCVARYGGHIAKFLGDGVLIYFGWPRAYEDQAERAVRAGLDANAAVRSLELPNAEMLNARVGIATGLVVVGDLVGDDARDADAVTGATPNLAARLQGVAEPGQAVIGEETYRLVRGIFQTESLGRVDLKGFTDPVHAWRILGEGSATSRFEATHEAQLHRLYGRDSELALLSDRWHLANEGEGQIVLISGEPGIGKSRLIQALRDSVDGNDATRLRYQCAAYHDNTALYPIVRHLEHAVGFEAGDDNDAKLIKLEAMIEREDRRPTFAELLSLGHADRYGASDLTPQQKKERTLQTLIDELLDIARNRPVLFLFEDAHWVDPTTQELLDEIAPKIADARVLMVITHRPEWQAPFLNQPHTTMLTLNRLGRRQGGDIVREIADRDLSDEVVGRIVQRADGVPLFIEELTKAVTGHGSGVEDIDIPATLQASLLARLDRLGSDAKEVAQMASVIGREFDYGLLSNISAKSGSELGTALDQLVASELVFRHGVPPDASFTFKHALFQDAAYDSLLRERRRPLHGRIADALGDAPREDWQGSLDARAFHLSRAERHADAAEYWCAAGEQAVQVFALKEATSHFGNGLTSLDQVASGSVRDRMELRMRRGLSMPLMITRGLMAGDVEHNLLQANSLSRTLDSKVDAVQSGWGLFHIYEIAGRWRDACEHADEIMAISEATGDADLMFQSRHAQWSYRGLVGDFANALKFAEIGWQTYDRHRHHAQAYEFGWHDPGCCAGNYLAWCNANLGFADRAARNIDENEAFSATLNYPSIAFCHAFSAMSLVAIRQFDEAERHAKTAIEICEEHGLKPIGAMSSVFLSRAHLAHGEAALAAEEIERILSRHRGSTRPRVFMPMHLAFLAEAYLQLGQHSDGLAAISDARRFAKMEDELAWWPEILRIEALLTGATDRRETESMEILLRQAIDSAHTHEARTQELRCATDLARLLGECGDRSKAYDLLKPVFEWFTEGFSTPDLKAAKSLLNELA